MTIFNTLIKLAQPADVQILPKEGSLKLVDGYLGLTNTIRVQGVIRIKTNQPIVSVTASLHGKIFTSNGDARNHSPYEAFGFLNLGPDEVFGAEEAATDQKQQPQLDLWNEELGVWDIPFEFPISWGGVNKIHESISASNPEWGFGARISYEIEAVTQIGTRVNKTQLHRNLEMIPYIRLVNSAYERLFISSVKATCPVEIIKYSPVSLKSILLSEHNVKNWSSETDVFAENEDLGVGHNFDYSATLSSTVFGPGDKVKFEFRVRSKPSSRLRIDSVRVWLEEVQGVGISVGSKPDLLGQRQQPQERQGIDLSDLMSGTTLDRKYLAQDLLVWKGTEDEDGDFWKAFQQLSFDVPRLASRISKTSSFFEPKGFGINPSGHFANRIHIEHKFRVRINAVSSRGDPLPPFDLPAAIVQVTPFSTAEAEIVVSYFPKLAEEIVRESHDSKLIRRILACIDESDRKMDKMEKQISQISLNETIFEEEEEETGELGCETDYEDALEKNDK
ncbi:UNVERIFIED_CONTAM: hypothetical protein HDU68_011393 [Siphonaria sp. JEL0065]|nr:hypothetical protein HDU68_011393 [Siphonaria sp. JEL0065]